MTKGTGRKFIAVRAGTKGEKNVPWGTSTMSHEEFWGNVEKTKQTADQLAERSRTGARSGR